MRASGSMCERWCEKYRRLGASEQPVEEQLQGRVEDLRDRGKREEGQNASHYCGKEKRGVFVD